MYYISRHLTEAVICQYILFHTKCAKTEAVMHSIHQMGQKRIDELINLKHVFRLVPKC